MPWNRGCCKRTAIGDHMKFSIYSFVSFIFISFHFNFSHFVQSIFFHSSWKCVSLHLSVLLCVYPSSRFDHLLIFWTYNNTNHYFLLVIHQPSTILYSFFSFIFWKQRNFFKKETNKQNKQIMAVLFRDRINASTHLAGAIAFCALMPFLLRISFHFISFYYISFHYITLHFILFHFISIIHHRACCIARHDQCVKHWATFPPHWNEHNEWRCFTRSTWQQ